MSLSSPWVRLSWHLLNEVTAAPRGLKTVPFPPVTSFSLCLHTLRILVSSQKMTNSFLLNRNHNLLLPNFRAENEVQGYECDSWWFPWVSFTLKGAWLLPLEAHCHSESSANLAHVLSPHITSPLPAFLNRYPQLKVDRWEEVIWSLKEIAWDCDHKASAQPWWQLVVFLIYLFVIPSLPFSSPRLCYKSTWCLISDSTRRGT